MDVQGIGVAQERLAKDEIELPVECIFLSRLICIDTVCVVLVVRERSIGNGGQIKRVDGVFPVSA